MKLIEMTKMTLSICLVGLSLCALVTATSEVATEETTQATDEDQTAQINVGLFTSICSCCSYPHCACASQCYPRYWMRGTLTLLPRKCDCKKCCCKKVCNDHDCPECNSDCCKHCDCDSDCASCGCKSCKSS